jgi:hypothetical protein
VSEGSEPEKKGKACGKVLKLKTEFSQKGKRRGGRAPHKNQKQRQIYIYKCRISVLE